MFNIYFTYILIYILMNVFNLHSFFLLYIFIFKINIALKMGAKYNPKWTNSSTHLICTVKGTPKYNEVKGNIYISYIIFFILLQIYIYKLYIFLIHNHDVNNIIYNF